MPCSLTMQLPRRMDAPLPSCCGRPAWADSSTREGSRQQKQVERCTKWCVALTLGRLEFSISLSSIFIHQGLDRPSSVFPPRPPPLSRSHKNQASSTCDAAHLLVLREGPPSTNHLPNSARRGWRKHLSRFAVDNREGHSLTESPARTAGSSVYSRRGLPQKA